MIVSAGAYSVYARMHYDFFFRFQFFVIAYTEYEVWLMIPEPLNRSHNMNCVTLTSMLTQQHVYTRTKNHSRSARNTNTLRKDCYKGVRTMCT